MGFSTMQNGIYHLRGVVKHYDWGGLYFIPRLLNVSNNGDRPFAEYWIGVHPLGITKVLLNTEEKKLSELFPDLPYLFKVLDVKDMLSIQVHPSRKGAVAGYGMEDTAGIPLDSPLRNYKDQNHKPELMIALSDFWLLHGFRPEKELEFTLLNVVELRELLPVYNQGGYAGLYKHVMEMPQEEVNRILEPLIKNISELYKDENPEKDDEDFWVSRAAKLFCPPGHIDRGIFSIFLLNLVHLQKGEGIFQDAGVPHAYLEGQNVEIMANSDNVLRGGLTNKHIAVEELMKHIKCEPTIPHIIKAGEEKTIERIYEVPVHDFRLNSLQMQDKQHISWTSTNAEILILTEGHATLFANEHTLELGPGHPAALVMPGTEVSIRSIADSVIFRASIPQIPEKL